MEESMINSIIREEYAIYQLSTNTTMAMITRRTVFSSSSRAAEDVSCCDFFDFETAHINYSLIGLGWVGWLIVESFEKFL